MSICLSRGQLCRGLQKGTGSACGQEDPVLLVISPHRPGAGRTVGPDGNEKDQWTPVSERTSYISQKLDKLKV
jgi:hypothetical protein